MSDKMDKFNKYLIVLIPFLIIITACSSSINANISKLSADIDSIAHNKEICGLDDEDVTTHMFCYIKSGEVDHHCPYEFWNGTFFGILIKIGTGIGTFGAGSLYIHLTGEDDEPRLTVSKVFRKITYIEDVNVSVKGFIGVFQPTGHISGGLLFGFALITCITPL